VKGCAGAILSKIKKERKSGTAKTLTRTGLIIIPLWFLNIMNRNNLLTESRRIFQEDQFTQFTLNLKKISQKIITDNGEPTVSLPEG
jgi:hypothetical protein